MIKNIFIWDRYNRYIVDEHGQYFLEEKPMFSFEYETITYHKDTQSGHSLAGEAFMLTVNECQEIENFIKQKRDEVGILKHCVNKEGEYLGLVDINDERVYKIVDTTPMNSDPQVYDFESNSWVKVYFYDSEMKLVYNKDDSVGHTTVPPATNFEFLKFDNEKNEWKYQPTEEQFETFKSHQLFKIRLVLSNYILSKHNLESIVEMCSTLEDFDYDLVQTSVNNIETCNTVEELIVAENVVVNFINQMMKNDKPI